MKTMKKVRNGFLALGLSLFLGSCSDDDDALVSHQEFGRMNIEATATYSSTGAKNTVAPLVEVSLFAVNFKEIELEYTHNIDQDGFYGSQEDVKLEGPFELELLLPVYVPVVEFRVPNGQLDEIEFTFDKGSDTESDLYDQSVRMEGTIDAVPFVFWHDFEEDIELKFSANNPNAFIGGDFNDVLINFDLTNLIHASPTVDLSAAVDGNGDGTIEIGPQDPDGNQALAESIKQALKQRIELIEEPRP